MEGQDYAAAVQRLGLYKKAQLWAVVDFSELELCNANKYDNRRKFLVTQKWGFISLLSWDYK